MARKRADKKIDPRAISISVNDAESIKNVEKILNSIKDEKGA